MSRNPVIERIERDKRIGNVFRRVLDNYGLADAFDPNALYIGTKVIREKTGNKQKLSSAVLDHMFPKETVPVDLMHYTSPEGLAGIAYSGQLRLYGLRKRIDEAEIKTFAKTHRLDGYLDTTRGEPYYKELSDDLFYTSFARPTQQDEGMMWNVFAKGGTGVRLRLQVTTIAAELRSIQYERSSRTLLNELNDALALINASGPRQLR